LEARDRTWRRRPSRPAWGGQPNAETLRRPGSGSKRTPRGCLGATEFGQYRSLTAPASRGSIRPTPVIDGPSLPRQNTAGSGHVGHPPWRRTVKIFWHLQPPRRSRRKAGLRRAGRFGAGGSPEAQIDGRHDKRPRLRARKATLRVRMRAMRVVAANGERSRWRGCPDYRHWYAGHHADVHGN